MTNVLIRKSRRHIPSVDRDNKLYPPQKKRLHVEGDILFLYFLVSVVCHSTHRLNYVQI